MSGSQSQLGGAPSGPASDPSMEDILASIRRILSEEDNHSGKPAPVAAGRPMTDDAPARMPPEVEQPQDVLLLDNSMLVRDAPPRTEAPKPAPYHGGASIPPPPVVMPFPASAPQPRVMAQAEEPPPPPFVIPVPTAKAAPPIVAPEPPAPQVAPPAQPAVPILLSISPTGHEEPRPLIKPPVHVSQAATMPPDQPEAPPPMMAPPPMESAPPVASAREIVPPFVMPPMIATPAPAPMIATPAPAPMISTPAPAPMIATPAPAPMAEQPPAVESPAMTSPKMAPEPKAPEPTPVHTHVPDAPASVMSAPTPTESSPMSASLSVQPSIASQETTSAAAGSISNLVRALTSDRGAQVSSGGPTIADIVREEMRPMLKSWLDNNLPNMVERMVRSEIDRVIARATQ